MLKMFKTLIEFLRDMAVDLFVRFYRKFGSLALKILQNRSFFSFFWDFLSPKNMHYIIKFLRIVSFFFIAEFIFYFIILCIYIIFWTYIMFFEWVLFVFDKIFFFFFGFGKIYTNLKKFLNFIHTVFLFGFFRRFFNSKVKSKRSWIGFFLYRMEEFFYDMMSTRVSSFTLRKILKTIFVTKPLSILLFFCFFFYTILHIPVILIWYPCWFVTAFFFHLHLPFYYRYKYYKFVIKNNVVYYTRRLITDESLFHMTTILRDVDFVVPHYTDRRYDTAKKAYVNYCNHMWETGRTHDIIDEEGLHVYIYLKILFEESKYYNFKSIDLFWKFPYRFYYYMAYIILFLDAFYIGCIVIVVCWIYVPIKELLFEIFDVLCMYYEQFVMYRILLFEKNWDFLLREYEADRPRREAFF